MTSQDTEAEKNAHVFRGSGSCRPQTVSQSFRSIVSLSDPLVSRGTIPAVIDEFPLHHRLGGESDQFVKCVDTPGTGGARENNRPSHEQEIRGKF